MHAASWGKNDFAIIQGHFFNIKPVIVRQLFNPISLIGKIFKCF